MIDEVLVLMVKHKEVSQITINDEAKLDLADDLEKWMIREGELGTEEIGIATMIIKGFITGYYHGDKNSK